MIEDIIKLKELVKDMPIGDITGTSYSKISKLAYSLGFEVSFLGYCGECDVITVTKKGLKKLNKLYKKYMED